MEKSEPRTPTTGAKRRYDGSRRRAVAQRNHGRILDGALRLFLRDGYAATTVTRIAATAGVSAETVYKRFGGKAGLIRAIYQGGLAGQGPVAAPVRSDVMSEQDLDAATVLHRWTRLSMEVAPRVSPVVMLVRAASATDPDARALMEEITAERLTRMTHNAHRLLRHAGLRDGLTMEHIRDVLFAYTAPELFELLVVDRHWTVQQYADFLYNGMVGQLLDRQATS